MDCHIYEVDMQCSNCKRSFPRSEMTYFELNKVSNQLCKDCLSKLNKSIDDWYNNGIKVSVEVRDGKCNQNT